MWKKVIRNVLFAIILCFSSAIMTQAQEITTYSDGFFQYHLGEGYVSICGYFGNQTQVQIPASIAGRPVTIIENDTFNKNSNIEQIHIPDTVTYIEENVFKDLQSLKKIVADTVDVTIVANQEVSIEYLRGAPEKSEGDNNQNTETPEENVGSENDGNVNNGNGSNENNGSGNVEGENAGSENNGNVNNGSGSNENNGSGNVEGENAGNENNGNVNNGSGSNENNGSGNVEGENAGNVNNGSGNEDVGSGSGNDEIGENNGDAGEGNGEMTIILGEEDSTESQPENSDSSQKEPGNTATGEGEHTENITLDDLQTESDKKPGVSIPSKDVTITVNDKQQLVAQNKETGEEEVLDDKKTYTVEEKEDGSVEIVDKDGEKVVVEENGDVLLDGKEIVTVGATSVEEKTPEKQNPVIYVVIIAAVVVVGVLYAKRKKSTK